MVSHRATGRRAPVPRELRHAGGGHRARPASFGVLSLALVALFVLALVAIVLPFA